MNTFWRLLGFLRPYRRGVLVSFLLAAAAMGVGVLIPYVVGRTVDEIRDGGVNLWPLALAVAGAGVLRLAFSVARRLVAGRLVPRGGGRPRPPVPEHPPLLRAPVFVPRSA